MIDIVINYKRNMGAQEDVPLTQEEEAQTIQTELYKYSAKNCMVTCSLMI